MAFPLAGLMFDFLDGKVARWRKSSSMLGQELDSLADLVCCRQYLIFYPTPYTQLDIFWSCTLLVGFRRWTANIPRHGCPHRFYLLRIGTSRALQCYGGFDPQK